MLATLGIIIDIFVIALLVIFALIGLKKGLFKSILSIFSWGVCILIAVLTAKYVAGWINGLYDFSSLIGKNIAQSLTKMDAFFGQSVNVYEAAGQDALIKAIPSNVNSFVKQLIKVVFSNTKVDMSSTDTIGSIVGSSLGHICMIVIAGILVFIILKIATALLTKLFDKMSKTRVIGGLNKILGLVLGLLKGALVVAVVNVVLVALTLMPAVNKTITPLIQDNTHVEKVVYNTTDKLFGKYFIEGDMLQNWVEDLWEKR